jgi:hypothetical protein
MRAVAHQPYIGNPTKVRTCGPQLRARLRQARDARAPPRPRLAQQPIVPAGARGQARPEGHALAALGQDALRQRRARLGRVRVAQPELPADGASHNTVKHWWSTSPAPYQGLEQHKKLALLGVRLGQTQEAQNGTLVSKKPGTHVGVVVRGAGRSLGALLERCSDSAREQRLPLTPALPRTPSRSAAGTSRSWPCQNHILLST